MTRFFAYFLATSATITIVICSYEIDLKLRCISSKSIERKPAITNDTDYYLKKV